MLLLFYDTYAIILDMKRLPRAILTGVAAANLVACASEPETPNDPEVQAIFNKHTKYWNDRGFSLLGKTKLVTIGTDESFTCVLPDGAAFETYTDDSIASYCAGKDNETNAVLISLKGYNDTIKHAESKGVRAATAVRIALGSRFMSSIIA